MRTEKGHTERRETETHAETKIGEEGCTDGPWMEILCRSERKAEFLVAGGGGVDWRGTGM